MKRRFAAGLFLWLAAASCCLAFSSFDFFGGAVHDQITRDALSPLGFSEESLPGPGEIARRACAGAP